MKWEKVGTLAHNSAQWSSGFGFSCEPGHRQDIWQNYARTHVAYRPRILMSAPVGQGGGGRVGIEGHLWWADELGSMSDEDEGRECIGEWCSGPSKLWFFLIFIRVLFTRLLPWDRQESSLSPPFVSLMHIQITTLTLLTSPNRLLMAIALEFMCSKLQVYFSQSKNSLFCPGSLDSSRSHMKQYSHRKCIWSMIIFKLHTPRRVWPHKDKGVEVTN